MLYVTGTKFYQEIKGHHICHLILLRTKYTCSVKPLIVIFLKLSEVKFIYLVKYFHKFLKSHKNL